MKVSVTDLRVTVGDRTLLDGVDLVVATGAFVAIGPNGAGKSTLLRTLYRGMRPATGAVHIDNTDIWRTPARHAARLRAVVTQQQSSADGLRVGDVVATARYAHRRWYQRDTADDHDVVAEAMAQCRIDHLASRAFATLSGGERQRVLLARALAQQAPVLLLDEPTNHLDITAQLDTLHLLAGLACTRIVVLHDLDHAVSHADQLVAVHNGMVVAQGPPQQVFTTDLAREIFAIRAEIIGHPLTGRPHLVTAPLLGADPASGTPTTAAEPGGSPESVRASVAPQSAVLTTSTAGEGQS